MKLLEVEQTHTIIKGPHLIFIGGDDYRTYGVTVRSLLPKSEVEDRGKKREWDINDYSLSRRDLSFLGLSPDEEIELKAEVLKMVEKQE